MIMLDGNLVTASSCKNGNPNVDKSIDSSHVKLLVLLVELGCNC
jgi:hypothetical protein